MSSVGSSIQVRHLARAVALAAALFWSARVGEANAGSTDTLALTETDRICVSNHGRPDLVMVAADASGWRPIPGGEPAGGRSDLLQQFGMVPENGLRLKVVGGDQLFLRVERKTRSTATGVVTTYVCSVMDDGPSSSGLRAELAKRFRSAPSEDDTRGSIWIYVEDRRGLTFLPASQALQEEYLRSGQTIISMTAVMNRSRPAVFYSETMLEARE